MHRPPPLRQRVTAAATACVTLAVIVTLTGGMPYILWRATGLPWPSHARLGELGHRLSSPISDPLLIDLLAAVGWVCWFAFASTVVRESVWYLTHLPRLLRDRHLHHEHLSTLTVKGSLAALCVGTLVLALVSLYRPQGVAAHEPPATGQARPYTAATAPLTPGDTQQTLPLAAPTPPPLTVTAPEARPSHRPPAPIGTGRHHDYTVVEGDTLWGIAHTHLGDALKWPRIYALNKDRVQSDGRRLTDPDRISPGWRLTIPAAGNAPPPPSAGLTPPAPDSNDLKVPKARGQKAGGGHQGAKVRAHAKTRRDTDETAKRSATDSGSAVLSIGTASLIGITTAAGLLVTRRYWHWYQRRLRTPGEDAEVPALTPLVEKAAQAAHAATRTQPAAHTPTLAPRRTPPQQPGLAGAVTIGVRADTEVPLDELAVPGGCAWTGPGAEDAARALLVGILTAAERQRPRPARITATLTREVAERLLPGLPPRFSALVQHDNTAEVIRTAEQHLISCARDHAPDGTAPTAPRPPVTLVLITLPDTTYAGQLRALARRHQSGALIVLTLDVPLPDAQTWHITVDGISTSPDASAEAHEPLTLFHLTPEAGRDMVQVLLTAHGEHGRPDLVPAPGARAIDEDSVAVVTSASVESPPCTQTPEPSRPTQKKPVRLHVLGPVTLYARGQQEPVGTNLRGEVHEFLALLASHPTGLLASDIAHKLHLAPGSEQTALKNLRRAVRRALRAATGITSQEFVLLQGELHKLHPELVETDLADFHDSLKEVFATPAGDGTVGQTLKGVRVALSHYRGTFAQGGDYLWADAVREHYAVRATDAALRLARQAERAETTPGEREAVLCLLDHLGAIHPDHERLAQHTIRLYQNCGRHDAARQTYSRLKRHLAELGVAPEPTTQALIAPRARFRQAH